MKNLLVAILCVLSVALSNGQSPNRDSVLVAILNMPNDTVKVRELNRYAESVREFDTNQAMKFAEEARVLAQQINYKRGLGAIYENIGWINYRKGNYSQALTFSAEALKISRQYSDKRGIASSLNNIAAINYEQKQYDEAIRNFKKGYQAAMEIGERPVMSRSLNNIALSFLGLNKLDSAMHYTQLSIKFSESINDQFRAAFGKRTLGDIHYAQNSFAEAMKYYNEALTRAEKQKNNFLITSTLHRIGKTYLAQNNYDKALQYLKRNIAIAEEFDFKNELERTYKLISDVYRAKNDLHNVVVYQDKYIALHDSLYSQRSNELITLQQVKYESDIQQAQIDLLRKDAMLKEGELKGQRAWNYIILSGLTVVTIIGFILYFSNRQTAKMNSILTDKNEKINVQALQLKELNAAKDKLFSIISHDIRGPLASLRGLMNLLNDSNLTKEEFVNLSHTLKINLDYVSDDLDNLLNWARTQLKGFEANFELNSLARVVEEKINLYSEAAKAKDISFENRVSDDIEIVADKNHLGLILRNLIGNAIKFSNPGGKITLTSRIEKGKASLSITDTGRGMTEEEVKNLFFIGTHFTKPGTKNEKGLGIGLLLVKEFLEKNKGSISVISQPEKGSTFTVVLQGHKVMVEAYS